MDFYTYFLNWRKAYHEGRITYHSTMARFYEHQNEAMELWPKMMLEAYKAWIGMNVLKNIKSMDLFGGKWI